jgi:hypothetical protein
VTRSTVPCPTTATASTTSLATSRVMSSVAGGRPSSTASSRAGHPPRAHPRLVRHDPHLELRTRPQRAASRPPRTSSGPLQAQGSSLALRATSERLRAGAGDACMGRLALAGARTALRETLARRSRAGAWSSSVDSLASRARESEPLVGALPFGRRGRRSARRSGVLGGRPGAARARGFRMPARRARGSGRRDRGPHRSAGLRRGRQPGIALLARTSRRA